VRLHQEEEDEVQAAEGKREPQPRSEEVPSVHHAFLPKRRSSSPWSNSSTIGRPCGQLQGSSHAARSWRSCAASSRARRVFTVTAPRHASDAASDSFARSGASAPSGRSASAPRKSWRNGTIAPGGQSGGAAETRNVLPETSETAKPADSSASPARARTV